MANSCSVAIASDSDIFNSLFLFSYEASICLFGCTQHLSKAIALSSSSFSSFNLFNIHSAIHIHTCLGLEDLIEGLSTILLILSTILVAAVTVIFSNVLSNDSELFTMFFKCFEVSTVS